MQAELIRCPITKKNVSNQKQNMIGGSATTTFNILIRKGEQDQSQIVSFFTHNYPITILQEQELLDIRKKDLCIILWSSSLTRPEPFVPKT
jgi:hypothetical protein